jgi:hypothetical protein
VIDRRAWFRRVVPRQRRGGSPGRRSSKHSCVRPRRASRLESASEVWSVGSARAAGHCGGAELQDNEVIPLRTRVSLGVVRRSKWSRVRVVVSMRRGERRSMGGVAMAWKYFHSSESAGFNHLDSGASGIGRSAAWTLLRRSAGGRCSGCWASSEGSSIRGGKSRSASSPGDPLEGFDVRGVVAARGASGREAGCGARV